MTWPLNHNASLLLSVSLAVIGLIVAVARFKLADCHFALMNYSGALTNYWLVATNYMDLPRVQRDLVGQASYQIVRASIPYGDLASAGQAVRRILADYPPGDLNDRKFKATGPFRIVRHAL